LLIDEYGKKHRISVAEGNIVNSVGAGDSMIAWFISGYLKDKDYVKSVKLETACATAFGEVLAVKKDIDEILKSL
jgi:1-phosphofructokinase